MWPTWHYRSYTGSSLHTTWTYWTQLMFLSLLHPVSVSAHRLRLRETSSVFPWQLPSLLSKFTIILAPLQQDWYLFGTLRDHKDAFMLKFFFLNQKKNEDNSNSYISLYIKVVMTYNFFLQPMKIIMQLCSAEVILIQMLATYISL